MKNILGGCKDEFFFLTIVPPPKTDPREILGGKEQRIYYKLR